MPHVRNRYGNPTPMPKAGWCPKVAATRDEPSEFRRSEGRRYRYLSPLDLVFGQIALGAKFLRRRT